MHSGNRIHSIQFLRAVAAIGVVVHHALGFTYKTEWALGAVGIDVFFVISGFVMYVSIDERTRAGPFLMQRLWRVYPLYWIATGVFLAVVWATYGMRFESNHVLRSLLLFPPPAPHGFPVLYPGWTLTFEMVFYACLAAAIAVTRSRDCAAFIAGIAVVSMGLLEYSAQPFGFLTYILRLRLCEFALGLLCAFFWSRGFVATRGQALALLALALGYLLLHPRDTINGATPLLVWGVPSAAIVFSLVSLEASGIDFGGGVNRMLGESSYAIYLFHVTVITALLNFVVPEGTPATATVIPNAAFFLLSVTASIACGCAVWWLVDRPIQRLRRRSATARSA